MNDETAIILATKACDINLLFCTMVFCTKHIILYYQIIKLPPNIYGFELCLHSCLIILNSSLAAPNKSILNVGIFDTLEEEVNGHLKMKETTDNKRFIRIFP